MMMRHTHHRFAVKISCNGSNSWPTRWRLVGVTAYAKIAALSETVPRSVGQCLTVMARRRRSEVATSARYLIARG